MVRETTLSVADFILPLFVRPGRSVRRAIRSMPGNFQLSVDELVKEARKVARLRIPAIILFGIPEKKDAVASSGTAPDGVVQQAIRAVKDACPDLVVITDVCLCEYTSHGHCGIVVDRRGARVIDNDATLEVLAKMALSHAEAGADMVAPSDMMDGRVGRIRQALDGAGFAHVPIMAYSAKHASAFYGPFREAAESPPKFGDRRSYQMDPANGNEALREVALDIEEGADIVMVKPALAYLDVIWRVKERFGVPVAAYNVSGEFAMVKAASARGWLEEKPVVLEILTSIKRAGADLILTYFAKDAARWLAK
jgi:porphobilinogen synthase